MSFTDTKLAKDILCYESIYIKYHLVIRINYAFLHRNRRLLVCCLGLDCRNFAYVARVPLSIQNISYVFFEELTFGINGKYPLLVIDGSPKDGGGGQEHVPIVDSEGSPKRKSLEISFAVEYLRVGVQMRRQGHDN